MNGKSIFISDVTLDTDTCTCRAASKGELFKVAAAVTFQFIHVEKSGTTV